MKYAVVYSSEGNTKTLAQAVYDHINKDECVYFGMTGPKALEADFIYIGFWTDEGTCDKKTENLLKSTHNKKLFLFGSAGFGGSQAYFDKVISRVKAQVYNDNVIVDTFMCQGKMKPAVRERYVKIKETNPDTPNIDLLIQNFDMALSHPDDNDINNLIKKL